MKLKKLIILSFIILLTGCNRYINWYNCTFTGGKKSCYNCSIACPYKKSMAIYDQFQTIALFDVLWLHDIVRTLYTDLYAARHCLNCCEKQELLGQQLKLNQDYISFYVLMPCSDEDLLPTCCGSITPWAVCLKVDGQCYQPAETKVICNFPDEYLCIFDKRTIRYRNPYLISFNLCDNNGNKIINSCTKSIEFVISSSKYRTCATWIQECCQWRQI